MEKKKVIKLFGVFTALILVFLPGYAKFQELELKNRALSDKKLMLQVTNKRLELELRKMRSDPGYMEKVAREKLRVTKKGEVVYKVIEIENSKDIKK